MTKCIICKNLLLKTGYGNNAQPIADGRCCDTCNSMYVIPMRINNISKSTQTQTDTQA